MNIGKIKAELMNVHEEIRKIEVIRTHSTEKPTFLGTEELSFHGSRTGCAETSGTLFLAPALERSVTMICWKRVPRLGKLGKKWSDFLVRRLPDLNGRKVRLSEPETITPPLPEPVIPEPILPEPSVPEKQEPPPQIKELKKPVAAKASHAQRALEKRSQVVTPAENQKREPAKEKEPVIVEEPPKPLKVIRRRGEHAPKVFVTAPKTVPLAMLEGIALGPDEEAST
jgi:hypothetical protein